MTALPGPGRTPLAGLNPLTRPTTPPAPNIVPSILAVGLSQSSEKGETSKSTRKAAPPWRVSMPVISAVGACADSQTSGSNGLSSGLRPGPGSGKIPQPAPTKASLKAAIKANSFDPLLRVSSILGFDVFGVSGVFEGVFCLI